MGKWYDIFRAWWSPPGPEGEGEKAGYVDVPPEGPTHKLAAMKQNLLARWHRGSKRDQQLAALQAGYTELLDLIRSIRAHLDAQAEGQARLFEHLPAAMDSLSSVGKTSEKLVESMDRFNQTLSVMEETGRSSAQIMTRLVERTSESEETLGRMLERSERRLVVLIGFLAFVTVLVVGTGIYLGMATRAHYAAPEPAAVAAAAEALAPHGIARLSPAGEAAETEPEEVLDTGGALAQPDAPAKRRRFLFFGRR